VSSGADLEDAQRTRILEAFAEVMAERALGAGASAAEVAAHAGVSAAAFHETFADREACMLEAFELGLRRAGAAMSAAYRSEPRWLDSVKAALVAFLRFLEDEPALGRLLVVHSMGGGEWVLLRRAAVLRELAEIVDRGRREAPPARQELPVVIAEGVVGAVLAVLQNRLVADPAAGVVDLYGSLISIVVLPYLGAGVARRELSRPAPRPRAAADVESSAASALAAGRVRLTYRTTRVLAAIGDYPGASNREVAERAGIVDQGQVSKLLARLYARGLIEKIGAGRAARGAPNAWQLSEHGEAALRQGGAVSAVSRS
jgi:AcrR family transcriptional regulator